MVKSRCILMFSKISRRFFYLGRHIIGIWKNLDDRCLIAQEDLIEMCKQTDSFLEQCR